MKWYVFDRQNDTDPEAFDTKEEAAEYVEKELENGVLSIPEDFFAVHGTLFEYEAPKGGKFVEGKS